MSCFVAVTMGGESTHPRPLIKANQSPNSPPPQPEGTSDIEAGGWWKAMRLQGFGPPPILARLGRFSRSAAHLPWRAPACAGVRFLRRKLAGHEVVTGLRSGRARSALPPAGSRKLSVPTATSVAPASSSSLRACAALHAAHADDRDPRRVRRPPRPARARSARIAGPESPPLPPPSHVRRRAAARPALGGVSAEAQQRVDQRDRAGAALLRGARRRRPHRPRSASASRSAAWPW